MQDDILKFEKLKFPIGKFNKPIEFTEVFIGTSIDTIRNFPSKLLSICKDLNQDQLNWKYRPEGWNIRQVIHHCSDSHMNGIIRTKLALTEENPRIKPYAEQHWAELIDAQVDIELALELIAILHLKWSLILENMDKREFERTFFHPEDNHNYSIAEQCGLYAWHCNHHFAHVQQALEAKGKYN